VTGVARNGKRDPATIRYPDVEAHLAARGVSEEQMPPIAALLLMTGLTQVLMLEEALGVTAGHDTTIAFIEDAIARLEPSP
jgi:hypothetical protein